MHLAKATALNLLGLGTPVLLAVICVPVLVENLGKERFGLLGLLWAFLGTAALFDLGLGRAMTVLVSRRLSQSGCSDLSVSVRSGLFLLTVVGLSFSVLVAACSGSLVSFVKESSVSQSELRSALSIAAPAVLLVVVSSGVSCTFEAFQRFDYSNALRIVVGAGTVAGTALASVFTVKLPVLALVLVLSRLIALSVGLVLLSLLLKPHPSSVFVRKEDIKEIVRFGRWITAANLMGPLLAYGDRFALSALVPAGKIAYYLVPYDLVTRTLVLPNAFVSSLFPRFSMRCEASALSNLLRRATLYVFVAMAVALGIAGILAHPGLSIWISPAFADQSFRIAQILCAGVLFNSLATIPFGFLQGQGWARQLVLAQLCEVPVYLLALHVCGSSRGASGIAIAWSGRMFVDAALLWTLVWRKFRLAQ